MEEPRHPTTRQPHCSCLRMEAARVQPYLLEASSASCRINQESDENRLQHHDIERGSNRDAPS